VSECDRKAATMRRPWPTGGGGGVSCSGENNYNDPIPVAVLSKVLSLRSLNCWDAGSNPVEGVFVCLLRQTDTCTEKSYRV
jgi:hypothetical protein